MTTSMLRRIAAHKSPFKSTEKVADVTGVIGAEAANAISVACTVKDDVGAAVAARAGLRFFLSDDANGDSIAAAAASGGIAGGANGHVTQVVTGKIVYGVTEADGTLTIVVTEAAAKTFWLVAQLPNGFLKVIGALVFA